MLPRLLLLELLNELGLLGERPIGLLNILALEMTTLLLDVNQKVEVQQLLLGL